MALLFEESKKSHELNKEYILLEDNMKKRKQREDNNTQICSASVSLIINPSNSLITYLVS